MPEAFTAETLARLQFAFTVSFHIIFPAFSIGLASYLAVLNGLWLKTRDRTYLHLFDYWKKIFAVAFGMGVVSGIVMSYQFGTNWSVFSDKTGPVLGPLMAYEVLSAFFLEAGFLGIMLFGRERVGDGLHMFATAMVALGTLMSATWILSVNSWMQTPAGYGINDVGQFVPVDWWQIVFNPSFPYRLVHMVLAAYLTTAFVVAAVGALHILRHKDHKEARRQFSMAMWMAALVTPIQIFAGDAHGLNTLEYQPQKVMAMEGHYDSHPDGAPLILFGIPDPDAKEIRYAIEIPKLSSLILKHDLNAPMDGLDTIPDEDEPPVEIVFWSFRIMVGLGFAMLGIGVWSLWLRYRGRLYDTPWLLRAALVMGPSGFIAVLAGWITTEVGRQPFTVYNLLRTSDSLAPVAAPAVAASLIAFIVVYFLIFGAGTIYILLMMNKAPNTVRMGLRDGPVRAAGITPGTQMEPDMMGNRAAGGPRSEEAHSEATTADPRYAEDEVPDPPRRQPGHDDTPKGDR
ncbi:MAG: cytochrome ubiquinol oxidase subunit I [Confluentimicrobium sp.]|nr:cytochrome ubiquinol oxidase subunit I [Actibacterium sp.]